jgi:tetratricopeptide (TPR) repeat protein
MIHWMLAMCLALASAGSLAAQGTPVDSAWDLLAKGQRAQAISLLRETIKADPRNGDARLLLGSVLMEDGQASESIEQLKEAVRLKPASSEAHNALGEAYNTFGQPKAARVEFEAAVRIDPRFAQAHANLAAALFQDEETAAAAPHLDQAISLMGKTADAAYPLYLRGKIHLEAREPAKAVSDLEQATKLRPDFAEAWSDLGEARRNLFDDAGALAAFQRAVELSPEDAVAQTRCGSKLLEMGNAHEAVAHLQAAVRLDPKNQSALNSLQAALRKDGQTEQADVARRQLAEVIRERDTNDQIRVKAIEMNNRGASLEKSGDVRGAIEKYRAALELQPEHAGIRANLATALLKLGQWDEGIAQLREAVRRDPHNADLQRAVDSAVAQAKANGIPVAKP